MIRVLAVFSWLTNKCVKMWPRCVYSLFFFFLFFFLWVDPAAEHGVIRTSKREIHTWTAGRITSWFQAHRLVFILIRPLYLFTGWTLAVNSPAPKGHAPPAALSMFYKYLGFFLSLFFFFFLHLNRSDSTSHLHLCLTFFLWLDQFLFCSQ